MKPIAGYVRDPRMNIQSSAFGINTAKAQQTRITKKVARVFWQVVYLQLRSSAREALAGRTQRGPAAVRDNTIAI
jgi:hypothetical protein